MGFGVFATGFIPKGTITWVLDPLDQIVSPAKASELPASLQRPLEIYSYQNRLGERVLCWDHARFVNHSCDPTSLAPGFDLEIAVRDIPAGQEITDDYGALNIDVAFACACDSPRCRSIVDPGDFDRYSDHWDQLIAAAFPLIGSVDQPLWNLVQEQAEINRILAGELLVPTCWVHAFGTVNAGR
jgi:hypothetical protein